MSLKKKKKKKKKKKRSIEIVGRVLLVMNATPILPLSWLSQRSSLTSFGDDIQKEAGPSRIVVKEWEEERKGRKKKKKMKDWDASENSIPILLPNRSLSLSLSSFFLLVCHRRGAEERAR